MLIPALNVDLVIFDCDGVLVDSEVISCRAHAETGALAAGMTVLGFHGGSHCRPGYGDTLRAAGAAMTFDDMRQLPDLIAQIGQKPGLNAGFSPV